MRLSSGPRSLRGRWGTIGYAVVAAWAAVMLLILSAARDGRVADHLVGPPLLVFALVGTVAAARAATHHGLDRRPRRAWLSMAVGFGLLLVSSTLFAAAPGFPGPGDYPRLCAVPFLLYGLVGMTSAPRTRTERLRLALDIGVVVTAGFMAMWYWSLGPLVGMNGVPLLSLVIATAYPMADLVLFFGAAAALLRGTPATTRRPLVTVVLGLTFLVVADLYYAGGIVEHLRSGVDGGSASSTVGQWVCLLSSFGLLALAAVQQCAGAVTRSTDGNERHPRSRITMLPYVAIGAGYALLLVVAADAPLYPWGGLVVGAVTMTGIVVARQVVVLRENQALLTTDYLTGLASRPALAGALARALARSDRSGSATAVLLIDLDGFKSVNDEFGHEAGDELLVGFAGLLRAAVAGTDTVGRLGGDEFAIVLAEIRRPDDAVAVALRLLDMMRRPLTVAGRPIVSRASIGIALSEPGDTGRLLMHRADQAMYRAKRARTGWSMEGTTEPGAVPPSPRQALGGPLGPAVRSSRATRHSDGRPAGRTGYGGRRERRPPA